MTDDDGKCDGVSSNLVAAIDPITGRCTSNCLCNQLLESGGSFKERTAEFRRFLLKQIWEGSQRNSSEAARQLKLDRSNFLRELKKYCPELRDDITKRIKLKTRGIE